MPSRILIIEDNCENFELMVYLLDAFGYETQVASDGEEGLLAASRDRPDLILCDIHLPKVDGYEVAMRLKSDPSMQAIPVVAVTALAMVGDKQRILSAGFDGYITKPIDPVNFANQIELHLRPEQ